MTTTPEDFNRAQLASSTLTMSHVTELVRFWQEQHKLGVDGKAGLLQTIPSLDQAIAARGASAPPIVPVDRVAAAGLAAVAVAQRYFDADIYDPAVADKSARAERSRRFIEEFIRVSSWHEFIPYKGNGFFSWCIVFLAKCYAEAGIDPKWFFSYWESTDRIDVWASYGKWDAKAIANPKPANGPYRLVAKLDAKSKTLPFVPQAGDILLVGDDDAKRPWGKHGEIVVSYDATTGTFYTIGGNAGGTGPDGKPREGVVRGERKLGGPGYCARRLIRISDQDLLAPK